MNMRRGQEHGSLYQVTKQCFYLRVIVIVMCVDLCRTLYLLSLYNIEYALL